MTMRAYLSSLLQPMTPDRSALYARVLGKGNSWADVALVEAREIINRSEPGPCYLAPGNVVLGSRRLASLLFMLEAHSALGDALSSFLSLDLEEDAQ